MEERVVPMIHVPDVRATVNWYLGIGFNVVDTFGDGQGGLSFALLSFGSSQVMFNEDGLPSARPRREVDLYVYTDMVDELFHRLKDAVDIVAGPHDTFYGMRELIIRDLNRFWITFGKPGASAKLMSGIREGNPEAVKEALSGADLSEDKLAAALAAASKGDGANPEIANLLRQAGAVMPIEVNARILQTYVGDYESDEGMRVSVSVNEGTLFVALDGQPPLSVVALNETSFRPAAFDDGVITFNIEDSAVTGFSFRQGKHMIDFRLV